MRRVKRGAYYDPRAHRPPLKIIVTGSWKASEAEIAERRDFNLDVRELASRYVGEIAGQRNPNTGRRYTREERIAMAYQHYDLASHGLDLRSFRFYVNRSKKSVSKFSC
jgi:hypothetical protein